MKKILWVAFAVLAASLPVLPATAADPNITFLNPSGYSPNPTISDKADRDQAVHLVAWVQAVPADPLVEFEIQPTVGNAVTLDAQRVGTDTWEAFVSVSSFPDGAYTLRAILYSGLTEADSVEQEVTLNRDPIPPPPPANTVEFLYPSNGSQLGFSAPAGKRPVTLLDAVVSEGTSQVRALYTLSQPGSEPVWVECGTKRVPDGLRVTVRCTLGENAIAQAVTAVAVVANDTPPGTAPSPVADATGDAHRVAPYVQRATEVSVSPETVRAEVAACQTFTVGVVDQFFRPIPAANVDVHVVGPNDQVRFGTIPASPTGSPQATSPFQAPDKAHVSQQDGINCNSQGSAGRQGDHNIPGNDDPQHIESTAGTDDQGKFYFALYSDSVGGSSATVWVDDDDDDVLDASEASGGAQIGWGQDAPPPTTELFFDPKAAAATSGTCVRVVLAVKRGGNPLSGANVDVHASGPDATIMFCTPPDASISRPPDQGHVGNDDEITRHLEGETNNAGQFIFGVQSSNSGSTNLLGWLDATDDDMLTSGEQSASATIQWDVSGERSISISSNKSRVRAGRPVNIVGSIEGAAVCESQQVVKLQRKRMRGGRFRALATTTTDDSGQYAFTIRPRSNKRYRTVAPASGACEKTTSRIITIRVT